MPPCAATVCERVGKTLVMQAVFSPACEAPSAARRPGTAGTHHDDIEGVVGHRIGAIADREALRGLLLGFDNSHQSPKLILRIA